MHFFKNLSFTGANLALTLVAFALMGSFFFMSQLLQSVMGFTPLQAGIRMLPMAVFSFIASLFSARLATRWGTKNIVSLGIMIAAAGFLYYSRALHPGVTYLKIVVGMCVITTGIGITMSPATNSVMSSVPVNKAGVGSAMNDTTRQIGGALGVAVLGTLLNSTYLKHINSINWSVLPDQILDAIRSGIQSAHIAAQSIPDAALSAMIITQSNEAFFAGAAYAALVASIVLAAASILTFIILPAKVKAHEENPQVQAECVPVTETAEDKPQC
jgi:Na+/melibiose symporter-like transporter